MGWKDWSYEKKGGNIGVIAFIVVSILLALRIIPVSLPIVSFILTILFPRGLIINMFGGFSLGGGTTGLILLLLTSVLFFILTVAIWYFIGYLIGWIYGKFKSR